MESISKKLSDGWAERPPSEIRRQRTETDFGAGFVNGSLKKILPEDPAVIKTLKNLGILNAKGNEIFYNCVVFPIYDTDGTIVNLYGRNIDPAHGVSHLYLAGSRSGLVNRQAVPRSASIILTESIIDAVTLYDQGFTNVIPAYGVNGVTEDHLVLFNGAVTEVYLCFDSDQAGKDGAAQAAAQLQKKGITVYTVELPDKDITIYFNRHTPEEFEQLLKAANPASVEQSDSLNKRKQTLYQQEEHGFTVGYATRQYQVKGIQRGDTQLKATIKVSEDVSSSKPFELTTIDLYSSRSRHWFILAIEEAEGMGGAAYSIRTIQSAKKITVAATGKDANGRMKTEEYT
jgi:DNA primase